jgi:hypothetical protein
VGEEEMGARSEGQEANNSAAFGEIVVGAGYAGTEMIPGE